MKLKMQHQNFSFVQQVIKVKENSKEIVNGRKF